MGAQCTAPEEAVLESADTTPKLNIEVSQVFDQKRVPHNVDPEQCAACLQPLAAQALGVCLDGNGHRVCSHYFHLACLRRVLPRRCPQCRASFERSVILPNIMQDPAAWSRVVAAGGGKMPTKREVLAAYKAMLLVPSEEVEDLLSDWPGWNRVGDRVGVSSLSSLARAMAQHMPPIPPSPWTAVELAQEDATPSSPSAPSGLSPEEHRGGSSPGERCSCGRIHVHRGDRVKRGQAWNRSQEDGGPGQLGTIVRDEEGCEFVLVQWDRSSPGEVRRYAWPADPEQHEVEHVQFQHIADEVRELQEWTGRSSAAVVEVIRRAGLSHGNVVNQAYFAMLIASWPNEEELRQRPKIFHRCRVLPDELFVRQSFDACPPCPCTRPTCRGGVRWNSQAAKHLGREGYLLKVDERDGTVLVELTGRCNCKIWFPFLAVQPVYDPDMAEEPRFPVGASVQCKFDGAWHEGTVNRVWWRPSSGWGNRSTAPYSVKLHDGRSVFAPLDSDQLIKAVPPVIDETR
eukprot:TRINITY_DN61857_c0_g1_i1.p1 TRINITY_DN61857_c0_g1~~TRINITY_DN61857_c0_g1_i1.p1  ORF type:complete len:537 (+),score=70.58 TRINITY_DN61857_c0_g1_i1:67-1611(+)